MIHMMQLDRVYSRFTIHRDEIKIIRYLPGIRVFVSFCRERNFKIWRCLNKDKKPQVIKSYKLNKDIRLFVVLNNPE
jgi:hypothetical protein